MAHYHGRWFFDHRDRWESLHGHERDHGFGRWPQVGGPSMVLRWLRPEFRDGDEFNPNEVAPRMVVSLTRLRHGSTCWVTWSTASSELCDLCALSWRSLVPLQRRTVDRGAEPLMSTQFIKSWRRWMDMGHGIHGSGWWFRLVDDDGYDGLCWLRMVMVCLA